MKKFKIAQSQFFAGKLFFSGFFFAAVGAIAPDSSFAQSLSPSTIREPLDSPPLLSSARQHDGFVEPASVEPFANPAANFALSSPPAEIGFQPSVKQLAASGELAIPATLPLDPTASESWDLAETDAIADIPDASKFRDVYPGDWAYDALNTLVQRYDCLVGYPDGTFRGNRPLSRYEFAAGLNACLQQMERFIALNTDLIDRNDFETLQRLLQEFEAELARLGTEVDSLEARVDFLDAHQFSTTTKLFGQVVIGVQGRNDNTADFFPVDGLQDTADPGTQVNLISNVQLSLFTQFSPSSLLLTGLQAGIGSTAPRLTNDTRLSYEGPTQGSVVISDLTFRQLIGDRFAVIVGPAGVNAINVFRGANRVESAGFGPISSFAQRNPIIGIGAGQGGFGFDWQITERLSLQGVYSSSLPGDPVGGGLFGGTNNETSWGLQLAIAPTNSIDVALHFLNAYSPLGRLRTGIGDDQVTAGSPINTSAIGGTVAWRITPRITLGGWGGYASSRRQGTSGSVETTNWMVFLNFPDLLGEGNMGGIYFGQPPRITSSDLPVGENVPDLLAGGVGNPGGQPGTTKHLELFYRYRLTNNIVLTPGAIFIFDPANTPASDTITIGALRATFSF